MEAGLAALGTTGRERPDVAYVDALCDFFTRAVVLPGHCAFPSGDIDGDRLLGEGSDEAVVLAQLLTTHFAHHGLTVAPAHENRSRNRPEQLRRRSLLT